MMMYASNCPEVCDNFTQESLMKEIMEYGFAMFDLALYCNTHPCDTDAIELHNKYSYKVKELVNKYQCAFGPLTIDCPCDTWKWIEGSWPWEERGNC